MKQDKSHQNLDRNINYKLFEEQPVKERMKKKARKKLNGIQGLNERKVDKGMA